MTTTTNLTASTKLKVDIGRKSDFGLVDATPIRILRTPARTYATFPGTPDSAQSHSNTHQYN